MKRAIVETIKTFCLFAGLTLAGYGMILALILIAILIVP